jgi:hypothetical protein
VSSQLVSIPSIRMSRQAGTARAAASAEGIVEMGCTPGGWMVCREEREVRKRWRVPVG